MIENYIIYLSSTLLALVVLFKLVDVEEEDVIYIIDNSDDSKSQIFPQLGPGHHSETSSFIEDNLDENEYIASSKYKKIIKCKYLINQLISCVNMKSEVNEKCQKFYNEKIEEFEKCDFIITNYSLEDMKENIIYFDINQEKNSIIPDYEENEEDTNDILKMSKDYELNEEIEIEERKSKDELLKDESLKENFIVVKDKDCIEYELSKKDENYIVCTKYE